MAKRPHTGQQAFSDDLLSKVIDVVLLRHPAAAMDPTADAWIHIVTGLFFQPPQSLPTLKSGRRGFPALSHLNLHGLSGRHRPSSQENDLMQAAQKVLQAQQGDWALIWAAELAKQAWWRYKGAAAAANHGAEWQGAGARPPIHTLRRATPNELNDASGKHNYHRDVDDGYFSGDEGRREHEMYEEDDDEDRSLYDDD